MMSAGLKVVCPQCRRRLFVTTEHYNPDISPNGSMVRFLGGYHIDWLTTSTTKCSEMACPECQGQLAQSGRLTVIEATKTLMETEEAMTEQFAEMDKADTLSVQANELGIVPHGDQLHAEDDKMMLVKEDNIHIMPKTGKPAHICDSCGKNFSTALALNGHKRSHK
jgi:uncharacterized protein YbaR (Trm112 family)